MIPTDQFSQIRWLTAINATGMVPPAIYGLVLATTGGTIKPGTYCYVVTALNAAGETLQSAEACITIPSSGTATNTITVSWASVTGATGYKVYGRLQGQERLLTTLGLATTYTDTGSGGSGGVQPPTKDTTGVTGTDIPGFGVCRVRAVDVVGTLYLDAPLVDGGIGHFFAQAEGIAVGLFGSCTADSPMLALCAGTPNPGDIVGAVVGSFSLAANQSGYVVLGIKDRGLVLVEASCCPTQSGSGTSTTMRCGGDCFFVFNGTSHLWVLTPFNSIGTGNYCAAGTDGLPCVCTYPTFCGEDGDCIFTDCSGTAGSPPQCGQTTTTPSGCESDPTCAGWCLWRATVYAYSEGVFSPVLPADIPPGVDQDTLAGAIFYTLLEGHCTTTEPEALACGCFPTPDTIFYAYAGGFDDALFLDGTTITTCCDTAPLCDLVCPGKCHWDADGSGGWILNVSKTTCTPPLCGCCIPPDLDSRDPDCEVAETPCMTSRTTSSTTSSTTTTTHPPCGDCVFNSTGSAWVFYSGGCTGSCECKAPSIAPLPAGEKATSHCNTTTTSTTSTSTTTTPCPTTTTTTAGPCGYCVWSTTGSGGGFSFTSYACTLGCHCNVPPTGADCQPGVYTVITPCSGPTTSTTTTTTTSTTSTTTTTPPPGAWYYWDCSGTKYCSQESPRPGVCSQLAGPYVSCALCNATWGAPCVSQFYCYPCGGGLTPTCSEIDLSGSCGAATSGPYSTCAACQAVCGGLC